MNESYYNDSRTVNVRDRYPSGEYDYPPDSFDERYDPRYDDRYDPSYAPRDNGRFDPRYDDRYEETFDEDYDYPFDEGYEAPPYDDYYYYDNRPYDDIYGGKPKRKRKVSSIIAIIIIIIAACVLLFCGYQLYTTMSSYKEASKEYKLVDDTFKDDDAGDDDSWVWNFSRMKELCEDAVGYISLEGVLSYPIVQADDNDKYLRNMINGDYNIAGSIFVDYRFTEHMKGRYCIIYGHNMNDGSMFGRLSDYEDEEFYKEHPYFDIYVEDHHYKYYVFSAFTAEVDGFPYNFDELSDDEFLTLVAKLRSQCPYNTSAPVIGVDDHVITLSTCVDWQNYDYRFVVCLVRGEEITK